MMRILFDATRLAQRRGRGSPTGIDRVVLAYGRWLAAHEGVVLVPVVSSFGRLTPMARAAFEALIAEPRDANDPTSWSVADIFGCRPSAPTAAPRRSRTPWPIRRLGVAARYLRSRLARRPAGDLYLNVGHSGLDRPGFLAALAAAGLPIAVMIHDLIPITHPEFCAPGADERHRRRLEASLAHAKTIIANSKSTAAEIATFAAARSLRLPPIQAAPLGVEGAFRPWAPAAAAQPPTPPYFVCVGTLEARKNLAFLLTLWRRLDERLGARAPHLVLVGQRGWENEAVMDHLERSASAGRLVHEVAGLDDARLAALIAGARALLAPSLAEGFDLPVAEALAMGASVIASDIPVHRELADGARLLDPLDGPAWLAAIEAPHPARLAMRAYAAPTWEAHFNVIAGALWETVGVEVGVVTAEA